MPSEFPYMRCPFCGRSSENGASEPAPVNGNGSFAVPSPVLHSWKEIASCVGCGVRTVQRWEHNLGLPVRRAAAWERTAVMAFPDEIEAWLRRAQQPRMANHNGGGTPLIRAA
jgi:hypothetical protein